MTKDAYYDMCEQLGTEPLDSEVPVEMDDFPFEVQKAWEIYSYLPDKIDTFNGNYFGKAIEHIATLMDLFEVHDKRLCLTIVTLFDKYETIEIKKKKK